MNKIDGNFHVGGRLSCGALTIPDDTLTNGKVSGSADIDASKLEQHHSKGWGQVGTSTTQTRLLHVVRGATARIKQFVASCLTDCDGASVVTVDLKKNGITCLSATIQIDSSTGNRGLEEAALAVTTAVVGDVLEAVITATASGTDALATGVYCELRLDEDYPT